MSKNINKEIEVLNKTQVKGDHYEFTKYAHKGKWMSYWYQIITVLELKAKNVLEIGIGDGIVSSCLAKEGTNVTTFDFDEKFET